MSTRRSVPNREGGVLIAQVHQLSGRIFGRILRHHNIEELNPAQGRIVYALWQEDGQTQTELAARTRLDKSTLALMLDRMETLGHVVRKADAEDARRRRVFLSARDKAQTKVWAKASEEMSQLFYHGLTAKEIDAFEATLRHILSNLDGAEIKE